VTDLVQEDGEEIESCRLQDEELRRLKHIAVEEGLSFTELVRRALSVFTDAYRQEGLPPWEVRLGGLVSQVRERAGSFSPEVTEREITAASREARHAKRKASRRR
jgi:hypothetical protein